MIRRTTAFTYIPRTWTPKFKVEITRLDGTTDDVSAKVYEGEFRRPIARVGIGDFTIKLLNVGELYSGLYTGGEVVKFYADLNDASTLKFTGRLDEPKESFDKGHFLNIDGRHTSFDLSETYVNYEVTSDTDGSTVLKNLVSGFLTGYTTTNVTDPIGTDIPAGTKWSNKPFIEIFRDVCILCSADGFVDNDKDIHFFAENSIIQDKDAVVEGQNLIGIPSFGKDTYRERTKVRVVGEDNDGMLILYTAGIGTREETIIDRNVSTMSEAKQRANNALIEMTLSNIPPEGRVISRGLENPNPGENIWISALRHHIHNVYKMVEIKDKVGVRVGTWKTELIIEKEIPGTDLSIKESKRQELAITKIDNPNNLSFSYNFTFDDTTNILSQKNTTVTDGKLTLVSGKTTGTMVTNLKTASSNITKTELRYAGQDLGISIFRISVDNGISWEIVTRNTLHTVTGSGKRLKIKVQLKSDSDNLVPEVDGLVVLSS